MVVITSGVDCRTVIDIGVGGVEVHSEREGRVGDSAARGGAAAAGGKRALRASELRRVPG